MADNRISVAQYHKLTQSKKREGRYGKDRRIKVGTETYDSEGEYKRYQFLIDLEKRGVIADLQRQVEFPLEHNGQSLCTYKADAVYRVVATGQRVIEDYKGIKKDKKTGKEKAYATEMFNLKKKMMRAFYGVEVLIITKNNYWDPAAVRG